MATGTVRILRVDKSAFDWTVLVQVIEADRVKIARDGDLSRSFHRFEFGDLQGIKVSAVVFDSDVAIVDGHFLPFRKYYISNVEVHEIPELVGTGLYSFYWVINEGTIIEKTAGSGELALPFYFELRSFQYFHFVADTDIFINVMGVFIHALPPWDVYFEGNKQYGRDYIIIDQSKRPVVLTLWDDYEAIEGRVIDESMASMPIIIAMRVRVTHRIDQGTFWIKGRVDIAWPLARFWHMACPHCYELYEFSSTLEIICLSYGQGMHEFPRLLKSPSVCLIGLTERSCCVTLNIRPR